METTEETDDTLGLGDIVANLMALFILLTVFVLLARIASDAADASLRSIENGTDGTFYSRPVDPIQKPGAYVVVTETGFGVIDMGSVYEVLMWEGESSEATLPGGLFIGDATRESTTVWRDNTPQSDHVFSVKIQITIDQVPPELAVFGANPESIVSALRKRTSDTAALDFIVYPDGLAQFAPVYQYLVQSNVCFRWQPWTRYVASWRDIPNPITIRPSSLLGLPGCPPK
jgi:hypothetical protein